MLQVQEVDALVCPRCSGRRCWRFVGRARRQNSEVACAVCGQCGERLFAKKRLPTAHSDALTAAATEFATALDLHRSFPADPGAGVVRPVRRLGALSIFEFVEGRPLSTVLQRDSLPARRDAMSRAGSWFAMFHGIGAGERGKGGFTSRYQVLLEYCGACADALPIVSAALEYLGARLGGLDGTTFERVRMHGDAKPDNFLVAGTRVVAFDVDGRFRNVREMDLAQFLVHVAMIEFDLRGRSDEAALRELEEAFLDGYRPSHEPDPLVLDWMKISFWLSFWMTARRRSVAHRWRFHHLFGKRLEACLLGAAPVRDMRRPPPPVNRSGDTHLRNSGDR